MGAVMSGHEMLIGLAGLILSAIGAGTVCKWLFDAMLAVFS